MRRLWLTHGFLEYMEELFTIEAENEKQVIAKQMERLKSQMLEIKRVNAGTTWEEIKEIMFYNNTWNELHEFYRLKYYKKNF